MEWDSGKLVTLNIKGEVWLSLSIWFCFLHIYISFSFNLFVFYAIFKDILVIQRWAALQWEETVMFHINIEMGADNTNPGTIHSTQTNKKCKTTSQNTSI